MLKRQWKAIVGLTMLLYVLQACGSGPASPPPEAPTVVPEVPVVSPTKPPDPQPEPLPPGKLAKLERSGDGFRLVVAAGYGSGWENEVSPGRWILWMEGPEIRHLLVDLNRGEVSEWPLSSPISYYAKPYTMRDGRIVGVSGNNSPGASDVKLIVQIPEGPTERTVGQVDAGLVAIAPAGNTVIAYSRFHTDLNLWLGSLWQYEWTTQKHTQVLPQGYPLGLLADGRAVAHRGERIGELVTWLSSEPGKVVPISPKGIEPYWGSISPDGKQLAYFHAVPKPTSWWGPRRAYASPNRVGAPPVSQVNALAIYEVTSGKTTVHPLPGVADVQYLLWDRTGHPVIGIRLDSRTAILRVGPDERLTTLYNARDPVSFAGWDGALPLVFGGDKVYRMEANGEQTMLVTKKYDLRILRVGDDVILDTTTGKRYRAPGVGATLGGFPGSGYVASLVQGQPQAVYHITKVQPVD